MPYQINKFNKEPLLILQDGVLDNSTSISLVGKNFAGYGELQNENFLWLLENFANESAPPKPITGQLWYDTLNKRVQVYNGTSWNIVGNTVLSSVAPTEVAPGDQWLDTKTDQLNIYNGLSWVTIGPEAVDGYGVTRLVSTTLRNLSGTPLPVIKATLNDTVISIIADRDFQINPLDFVPGFLQLRKGINLSDSSVVKGNIDGNSSTASQLETPRNINGVSFSGSSDITITASTTNQLIPGAGIIGSVFDGSVERTWNINATDQNVDDTIVKRDTNGNFKAGTIYVTEVVGNVTGNVIGNLTGTSTFTSRLASPVTINGVSFDGSQNITVSDNLKVSKLGDQMSGNLNFVQTNSGIEWTVNDNNPSIKFFNDSPGDANSRLEFKTSNNDNQYFRWVHQPTVGSQFEVMKLSPNSNNASVLNVRGSIQTTGSVSSSNFIGQGSSITALNASNLSTGTVPIPRLSGTYGINITGFSSLNVLKSGDTMSGFLTLVGEPTQLLHAATKGYVDQAITNFARVRAWVVFQGSNGTIINGLNVTSVVLTAGGRYSINIAAGTFADGNYAAAGLASDTDHFVVYRGSTANQLLINTVDNGSSNNTTQTTGGRVTVIMVG